MAIADPKQQREEIARLGNELLNGKIFPGLAPSDHGKFVAVDTTSGAYEVNESDLAAINRLRDRCPDSAMFLGRLGHATAYSLRSPR